ncbi:hypothetical protein ACJMK2_041599 [Sinanodonta woodiana]|uniref:Mediator of DNA damage checkpoint protein 1 n=1 Tax=Sinanodonta woodiana TaxID=1069815 RepID=A0ABD3W4P2_SINWO
MADLDQTQAINLDDLEDETDEEQDNKPVAHLKVPCQKGFPGRIFPLYEGDNLIGRQDTCHVCLPLKALSREHACIEIRGDNHMICDKNSRNRTRRGKMFLLPEVRYEIKHNDTLMFGDVNCVYLFGPQVNDGDDTGSETESESMFQTVPDEANGDEISTDKIKVVIPNDSADRKELDDHSNASSDILEPSQPNVAVTNKNRGLPGLFAVDMDSEQIWEKDQNVTVKETPAVGRTRTAFTETLILPESESETEDELEKRDLLACPTLAMEENTDTFPEPATRKILEAETQAYIAESDHDEEKDDSPSKILLGAATQAYPDFEERSKVKSKNLRHLNLLNAATQAYTAISDTDEDSDSSEILCETTVTNTDAAVDLGPTQAYSSFEGSSPTKLKKDGKERLIEKKDDGEKEEEELLIEEKEEEENEIVKNLFMSSTLACDNEPSIPENEEESTKDSITGKSDDSSATQVFTEDEDESKKDSIIRKSDANSDTQVFTEDEEESKKDSIIRKSDDNSATQVFIENQASTQALSSCEATKKISVEEGEEATQAFEENQATQIFTKGITCDGATQVFDDLPAKTRKQKADPEEDTTQACTEDVPTRAVTDASLCVVEKVSCKKRSRNLRNARTPKLQPSETTLVSLDNSITLPIPDGGDATVAVSEEATVAINEDEDISTHKGTILSSENDATQVFTAEETFLLEVPDDKPLSSRSSRTSGRLRQKKDPKVDGVVTGDCEEEKSTRGKREKRKKEISIEETVTQPTEKVNGDHSAANTTTRKSGRKSTVAASRKSKGRTLAEEATQAYGKDDDENEFEEEATEVPFSNLKHIENPREQAKEILSSDVKKNIEEFEPTQTFILEVNEVEKLTQVTNSNVTQNSPAFEPTHAYDMDVDELPGEEATQAYTDDQSHAIKKIGEKEQPIRKSSRKSKGSAAAAGGVHASRQRNIESSNKVMKVENGLQTEEATQAYREDGDEDVYLPSLQEVIQIQDVKKNKRETSTATSRKRISRSQEKVAETPLRDKQGNKQDKDKESDLLSDLMNLPALKQAAPEATQAYGLDEDETPPLSADVSSSPEAFLKSPVFPLPSTSPMKPALASSTRKKSPSPKCVTFAEEEKRENEPSAVLKDKRTRRSLNMDLSKNKSPVSIKKNRQGQTSKNSEESTDTIAVHSESVDGSEDKKNVPKSNEKVRKSAAGLALNKDQGGCDKVAAAETSKRLKRGSIQPESAKTGLTSKRSRKSDPPPIVKSLQNIDAERRGVKKQDSLSGELVVDDSKKRTTRSRGKTKDNEDKGNIGDETSNGTINQPTETPDIEINIIQADIKANSTRRSNRSQGKQSKDASALEPEAMISNSVSIDRTTPKQITHEKLSNSSHENHSITENSSRKSIRGKRSNVEGDTKTNSVRQDSIESQDSVAVSDKKAKTTRRRATIATGTAELDQNNQPADQFSHLNSRTMRQKVSQTDKTCKLEKITAPSPSHSKDKESGSILDDTNYEEESSGSLEGPGTTGERRRIKSGSTDSKNTQQARGRKRGSQEATLQTPTKQVKAQDVSVTPKGTKEKEESSINSPSLRSTSVAPTKPKVIFTGLSDDQGEKIVKDLGGELASSVYTCTHLVTDKIRRTVKLLCCLGRGVPIVSQTWLNSSKQSGMFLDPVPFLLQDSATEKQYKFSLKLSLNKAAANLMLAGYKVHVTKSVKPEPQQMKDILKCAGAEVLASMPKSVDEKTIVVSCDEDKAVCTPALNSEIPVVSAEFVLTGILRQEVDFNSYPL